MAISGRRARAAHLAQLNKVQKRLGFGGREGELCVTGEVLGRKKMRVCARAVGEDVSRLNWFELR